MTGETPIPHDQMMQHVRSHPFRLVFATISGAHLYGFPSADSDFDLRGVHLLPLETVVGLDEGKQTVQALVMRRSNGLNQMDRVSNTIVVPSERRLLPR